MKLRKIAVAAISFFVLAGCSQAGPEKDASYDTVVDLRDAYVEAGGSCPEWAQSNSVKIAAQSGDCDGATVLSVYLSRDSLERRVEETKSSIFGVGSDWLVGENWIINAKELPAIQEKMGGQIVSFTG